MDETDFVDLYEDLKGDLHAVAEKHGKRLVEQAARDATSSHLLHGIAQDLSSDEPTAEPQSEEKSQDEAPDERSSDAHEDPFDNEKEVVEQLLTKISSRLGKDD